MTASERPSPLPPEPRALAFVVMSADGVVTVPLPRTGEVTIGRAPSSTVRVDDAKASRGHATVRVTPGRVEIVDAGSRNGTLVGDLRLSPNVPCVLEPGALVTIGNTVLVLQPIGVNAKPRRLLSRAPFEARVAEEAQAARAAQATFAIVRVQVAPGGTIDGLRTTSKPAELPLQVGRADLLVGLMNETFRPDDVIALIAEGIFEVLLPRTPVEVASALAARLRARMREQAIEADVGVASYPRDGASRDALVSQAHAAPEEAGPKGVQLDTDAMARLAPLVERIASSTISTLIHGETGVGKEVMARAIHEKSPRASAPMVTLNCAALSEALLESELFGHEKGAFTGATHRKAGLLETAQGGTVFLDEIGDLPISLQAKLLRVLEQREVQPVGALRPRPIDVRFIAATHRDLEAEILAKRFREDLYFRLNGVTLTIPPLRERTASIEPMARAFVAQASALSGRTPPAIAPAVLALLRRYRWPGNIRELRNVMERATLFCSGDVITLEHLPSEKMGPILTVATSVVPSRSGETDPPPPVSNRVDLADLSGTHGEDERARILAALEKCAGNQTKAARLLGLSRRTLVSRLDEYAIPRPRK